MQTGRSGDNTPSPVPWITRVLALLCVSGAAVLGIGLLVGWVVAGPAETSIESGFDRPLLQFFHDSRSSLMTTFMRGATTLGGGAATVTLLVLGGIVSFAVTRQPRWPIFFAGVIFGAYQIYTLLKVFIGRERPTLSPLYDIASKAFPSGHAAAAAACFGALGFFALHRLPRPWSIAITSLCAGMIVLIGVTRVYLGVHWPTDVFGGWALGLAWVAVVALIVRPQRTPDPVT